MRLPRFVFTEEFRAGVVSAILLALASPPSKLGLLGLVALVPLLQVMFSERRVREGEPLRLRTLVFSFGIPLYVIRLHWLMLLGEASPLTFRWALPGMLLLLALYLTLGDWLMLWLLAKIRQARGAQAIWWFPGLWILVEWFRAFGDMGFPWLRLGSTQLNTLPFLQVAGLLGELGVSLFVVWVNVLVAVAWQSMRSGFPGLGRAVLSRTWAVSALLILIGGVWVYGVVTVEALERAPEPDAPSLPVGVVQANVDLKDKWDPAKRDSTFVPYTHLTRRVAQEGARLVIWPETAMPLDLPRRPEALERVRDLIRASGIYLYTGFPEHSFDADGRIDSYNSSVLMDDSGQLLDRYRKMHLLAFGERMPFQDAIPLLGRIDFGQAEWTPGPEQTIFEVDGQRFASMICFESIFSTFGRRAVADGAGFLVNITNDGWFGDTVLPLQHGWMAAMRAAENRVPLLRCANNGISFVADPSGRVRELTELFDRSAFVTTIHPRPGGSFYTRYGDGPLFFLLGLGGIFLLLVDWTSRRRAS